MATSEPLPWKEKSLQEQIRDVERVLYAASKICEGVSAEGVDLQPHERRLAHALAQDLIIFTAILRRHRKEDPEGEVLGGITE